MRVCGVIAEYDPFHRGHAWHLARAREACGADYVVCVLSTAFTQRGAPSFFAARDRARMALAGGADAVFALPVSFSVMEADRFAAGGVQALDGLGVVTHLSFGCEDSGVFDLLRGCAEMLRQPSEAFERLLTEKLQSGLSFPRAQAQALSETLGISPDILQKPNNILAVAYLKQLPALDSPMIPVPVQRMGRRDDPDTEGFLSSSVLRERFLSGQTGQALQQLPEACAPIADDCLKARAVCPPGALRQAYLYRLAMMDLKTLARYTTQRNGLPERVYKCAPRAGSLEELVGMAAGPLDTRAGVRRFLSQALLDLPRETLPARVPCVRLLGFREEARPLLAAIKRRSTLPVAAKPADYASLLQTDARAERIRALGCGSAVPLFQQSPVIFGREAL